MALNLITTTKIVPVTHFLLGTGVDSGILLPTTVMSLMHMHTEYNGLWTSIEIQISRGVGKGRGMASLAPPVVDFYAIEFAYY